MRARAPDKFDLYERAVQAPAPAAAFLRALHPGAASARARALTLGEDFCGSGAIARAWLGADPGARAVCVDSDPVAIRALLRRCPAEDRARLVARRADVLGARDPADVIAAFNFPVGYCHTREALVRYFAHARSRLAPRGVMAVDTYGGGDAFTPGRYEQTLARRPADAGPIRYIWEQRRADPVSARVFNAMHFRVNNVWRRDLFTYDWRLWSIPELRDAFGEAGFRSTEVHDSLGGAIDRSGRVRALPLPPGAPLDDNFVVYVVARR